MTTNDMVSSASLPSVDQYHNVEISVNGMAPVYVFKLRELSSTGMGVLVKEDSDLLNQIETGQTVDMKYSSEERTHRPQYLKTEIQHIAKDAQGRFDGHFILGLSINPPIE